MKSNLIFDSSTGFEPGDTMFSNLTHNAVNTLLLVCKYQEAGPVTTDFISKQLGLSVSYLESLMSQLKKGGFLISYRGPGGGYCTNGKPANLKLLDVLRAFKESSAAKSSAQGELDKNLIADLMQEFMHAYLQSVSFDELLRQVPDTAWGQQERHDKPVSSKKFKPLQIHKLPSGPNSVFSLAASMAL